MSTRLFGTPITKPVTLTQQKVAQQIAGDIRSGVYPVGTRLPSGKDLAQRFGVSPSVIREVTERLRAQGLIDSRQGSGCTVRARTQSAGFQVPEGCEANRADLANVFGIALDLEGAAAALAAVRRTSADIDALETILNALAEHLYTPDRAVELDIAFHVAVGDATPYRYFKDLLQYLNLQIRESVEAGARIRSRIPICPTKCTASISSSWKRFARATPAARSAAMSHLRKAAARLDLSMPGRDKQGEVAGPV